MRPDAHILLAGADVTQRVTAVECGDTGEDSCVAVRYLRDGDATRSETIPFKPFLWLAGEKWLDGFEQPFEIERLVGDGPLNHLAFFASWSRLELAVRHVKKKAAEIAPDDPAPWFLITDPVQQFLMFSGCTLFKEMPFSGLRRMQLDIETFTGEGFEFCNADRESDRITAIAMSDNLGWSHVLDGSRLSEKELLQGMARLIVERDPDVIEGHNIFDFDLPYIMTRAKKLRVKLPIGRDGSLPRSRSSRFNVADRVVNYTRTDIYGRHILDTYILVQLYDITHRSLESFGLKNVARHFGIAAPNRTYLDGSTLGRVFQETPEQLMKYALDDVAETRSLAALLSPVYFAQTQMLPFSYQNMPVRGNAAKIDALLLREYLRRRAAIPMPGEARPFEGGYTDIFLEGVADNVHHCDVRSLYPSLMLERRIGPTSDRLGAFLSALDHLRRMRLELKAAMKEAAAPDQRTFFDAQQSCLKILINSFYGYLGFSQARFNDFDAAESVTAQGRELLSRMIETVRELGGTPIEIDTDGIYYIPPEGKSNEAFRAAFVKCLPPGIDVEFDGEYRSMFSYKMKNYALLDHDGQVTVKGAALKSRGLERFQRRYIRDFLRLKLERRDDEIAALQQRCRQAIRNREWDISLLAKTETLQADPASYAAKIRNQARGRNAAYELALASGRPYRAGDQISYYVTGTAKNVAVHSSAKLVSDWRPNAHDENIAYYLDKLEALFKKFGPEASSGTQQELLL